MEFKHLLIGLLVILLLYFARNSYVKRYPFDKIRYSTFNQEDEIIDSYEQEVDGVVKITKDDYYGNWDEFGLKTKDGYIIWEIDDVFYNINKNRIFDIKDTNFIRSFVHVDKESIIINQDGNTNSVFITIYLK